MLPVSDRTYPTKLNELEMRLGYHFSDRSLLETALTHSSWSNERKHVAHNERLEFLGDAVLEICVSDVLYSRYPEEREGSLTRLRSRMVGEEKRRNWQIIFSWRMPASGERGRSTGRKKTARAAG